MAPEREAYTAAPGRRPWWGVAGVAIFAAGVWILVTDVPGWNATWYVPAWYGYLLVLDAAIFLLQGHSFVGGRRRELVAMMFWSVPFWFLFEAYNLRMENWYYVFVLRSPWHQALVTWLAFATVLPACFFHAELIRSLRWWCRLSCRPLRFGHVPCWVLGVLSLVLPLIWPRYFFWLVWGITLWAPEAVNYRTGAPSLLRDLESGRCRRPLRLLAGGLLAGLVWEGVNFWARCKWIYTVPGFEEVKFFEIPVAGLLGFPILSVAAFSFYSLLCHLLRGGRHWEEPGAQTVRSASGHRLVAAGGVALLFCLGTFALTLDHTARSQRPLLRELEGLDRQTEIGLRAASVASPERLLSSIRHQGLEALAKRASVDVDRLRKARRHATLALHKGMGTEAARLLLSVGVTTLADLAEEEPAELTRRLRRVAEQDEGQTPRPAEVRVWIRAARRASGPVR
jgi:hypothetical protein